MDPNPASFNVQLGGCTNDAAPGANAEVPKHFRTTSATELGHAAKWVRRAHKFIIVTIIFSFFMGVLAIVAGAIVDSSSCLAFGLESFVDVIASALVLWRFWDETEDAKGLAANIGKEERTNVGISATFIIVAVITGGSAISHLAKHTAPANSAPILVFAAISVIVLSVFAVIRVYINKRLASKAMEQDAVTCLSTVVLSIGILVTAALYQTSQKAWWLDAVFAISVTVLMALYSIPILVTRPWWRRAFWKPWEGEGKDQGLRLRTQPDSSSAHV